MPDDDTGIPLGHRALFGVAGISGGSNPINGSFHASEQLVGVTWPVAGVYYSFDTVWSSHQAELDEWAQEEGRILHMCWLVQRFITKVDFADILAGLHDAKIDEHLAGMAAWPGRVICRLMPEMNGNWAVYSVANTGIYRGVTSTAQWISVWQYLVAKGRTQAPNVEWFWAPNGNDVGAYTAESYYPGDTYVDWIGFDAYNSYGAWGTPYDTWAPIYDRICALNATAPVMIGETGCKEDVAVPGRKAAWIEEMFNETRFERLKIVTYFDTIGGFDWRFQTSQSALDAFTAGFDNIINEDAIDDEWGVWPASPPPPEVFVPDPLPMLELPTTDRESSWAAVFTDPDWHRQSHGNAAHYINQIGFDGGSGNLAQRPKTAGNTPAVEAAATATGVASIAIMRVITTVFEATKRAFATRSGGASVDHWGVRMDGRQDWGSGSAAADTHLYRNAAGQLATGAFWLDETSAPSSNPATGMTIYAEGNALKGRIPGLGSMILSRRSWDSAYSSTHVLNDNPKLASSTGVQVPTGIAHLATLFLSATKTITNVHVEVMTAGSGLANCFVAVYDIAGTLLGVSGDVSTQLQSTGVRTLPLTTPVANVLPQKLVIGLLVGSGTAPFVRVFPTPGNWSLTGISQLFVRAGGSGLTALPSPINIAGLSASVPTAYLAALS